MAEFTWEPDLLPATCVPAAAAQNEFSLLFPGLEAAEAKILDNRDIYLDNIATFNTIIEDVFQITLDVNKKANLFFLHQLSRSRPGQSWLGINVLEEGLLEFSIFAVQGAADLTSVFFKGQSWNEQRTKTHDWLVKTGFVMLTCPYFSLPHIRISVNIEIFCV